MMHSQRFLMLLSFLPLGLCANDNYDSGSRFASDIKAQGTTAISGMQPGAILPGYTPNPPERQLYGGITAPGNNMDDAGNRALQESEVGQAITASILNNPKEPISVGAPFISAGFDQQRDAEGITGGDFDGCTPSQMRRTIISRHTCDRDVNVMRTCTRSAYVTTEEASENYRTEWQLDPRAVSAKRIDNYWIQYDFHVPNNGTIGVAVGKWEFLFPADPKYHGDRLDYSLNVFGQTVRTKVNYSGALITPVQNLNAGQVISLLVRYNTDGHHNQGREGLISHIANGRIIARFTVAVDMVRTIRKPVINWSEPCALSQEHGTRLVGSICSEAGGYRDVVLDGVVYHIFSDCWQYTNTYRTQNASEGSCGSFSDNPACTLATKTCSFFDEGLCLHENVIYSCETIISSEGMICGGQFFCSDGSCAQTEAGNSDSFQKALSQLAAVAAAGEDVAELNSLDVKAFSGQKQSCRKATAGFNDCCKSSGWGSDAGLAHCSSAEKALGQARERKLTVEVGEYCDKRVLGVCLQKKRGFCQFDSKLAQIIQQQGRHWQLGIGFGGAKNPDCRGITVDELQRIKFDALDFKNFYQDLDSGSDIPADNQLIEKAREEIQRRLSEARR
ncbi:type-F conjugative transfer system mating-pair stabilization protein TraN [Pantoea sp. DY-15]|uniref:type-F conjugative transfer system mating-pair stabilization protein TraN n=1 Tax=Pantoea sp. DY-15 TaxID=2871489 RepID=UPI001C9591D9|nr:type-F conjugative transfer system mating-pair stabilization protein TraN [Pantoea sp. DY-15]MBY4890592.1 type-F conjugative transfer system mating-pair stabilization protein TraN [Pantoea sp. DY-15]